MKLSNQFKLKAIGLFIKHLFSNNKRDKSLDNKFRVLATKELDSCYFRYYPKSKVSSVCYKNKVEFIQVVFDLNSIKDSLVYDTTTEGQDRETSIDKLGIRSYLTILLDVYTSLREYEKRTI